MPDSSGSSPILGDERWLAGRELVTVAGNEPWPLADEDRCWAVVEGAVDIFVVHVGEDGETGARRHVAVAGPGQLLAGGALVREEDGVAVTLLAVPSNTAGIVTLTRGEVRALLDDPVERLLMTLALSDWAETLCVALPETRRPFTATAAAPGSTQTLAPGESLVARGGAACVRVIAGTAHLVSDPEMPLGPSTGWVPLTGDTWLEAEDEVSLETVHLAVALRGEPGMEPIDHLYALLMAGLLARYRASDDREAARLRLREATLRHAFARTLARQAGVLDAEDLGGDGAEEDPLLGACRIIGRRMGVRFTAPPSPPGRPRPRTPSRRSRGRPTSATGA